MNNNIEIRFYDFSICKCKVYVKDKNSNIESSGFVIAEVNNSILVYKPNTYATDYWPWTDISWKELKNAITYEFKNKFKSFGELKVNFRKGDSDNKFIADVEYPFLDINIKGCIITLKGKHPFVYLPPNFTWQYSDVSWIEVRKHIVDLFNKRQKSFSSSEPPAKRKCRRNQKKRTMYFKQLYIRLKATEQHCLI